MAAESVVFLLLAHGLVGRLHGERSRWILALHTTRKALGYLETAKAFPHLHAEVLVLEGLYNYYVEWLAEHNKVARYLRFFISEGDKKMGMEQLEKAAYNAFYTRVEAQHFLASILDNEKKYPEALRIMSYLVEKYPDNAYFQREYANMLYKSANFSLCRVVSEDMLRKVREDKAGYRASQRRYAELFPRPAA